MKRRFQIPLTLASGLIVTDSLVGYFRPGMMAKHRGTEALLLALAAILFMLALLDMLGLARGSKPKPR